MITCHCFPSLRPSGLLKSSSVALHERCTSRSAAQPRTGRSSLCWTPIYKPLYAREHFSKLHSVFFYLVGGDAVGFKLTTIHWNFGETGVEFHLVGKYLTRPVVEIVSRQRRGTSFFIPLFYLGHELCGSCGLPLSYWLRSRGRVRQQRRMGPHHKLPIYLPFLLHLFLT